MASMIIKHNTRTTHAHHASRQGMCQSGSSIGAGMVLGTLYIRVRMLNGTAMCFRCDYRFDNTRYVLYTLLPSALARGSE